MMSEGLCDTTENEIGATNTRNGDKSSFFIETIICLESKGESFKIIMTNNIKALTYIVAFLY